MSRKPRNIAASVRQRLTNLARRQGEDSQLVLTGYVIERFLYRLSRSQYRDQFILKGAMLFRLWTDQPHCPTRDLDLLGKGNSTLEHLVHIFQTVCDIAVEDDGLTFDLTTVRAERIKEGEEYEGVRIRCDVRLGQARIGLQIDIGFGDAVTPGAVQMQYPTILEFPAPVLLAYPVRLSLPKSFRHWFLWALPTAE